MWSCSPVAVISIPDFGSEIVGELAIHNRCSAAICVIYGESTAACIGMTQAVKGSVGDQDVAEEDGEALSGGVAEFAVEDGR